jgi:hypothetical protein
MIASTLIAATVAAAQPAPMPQPAAAPAPAAEKKMACCDKMAKGEACGCCKDMGGKTGEAAPADQGDHNHH